MAWNPIEFLNDQDIIEDSDSTPADQKFYIRPLPSEGQDVKIYITQWKPIDDAGGCSTVCDED